MATQDTLDKLVTEMAKDGKLTTDEMNKARKIKNANVNLAIARIAAKYVNQNVKLAANWDNRFEESQRAIMRIKSPLVKLLARVILASLPINTQADRCVYGKLRQDSQWQDGIAMKDDPYQRIQGFEAIAAIAQQYGCGNCMEMAAMAFMYLYRLNVRPLDYMALMPPADHAFVVIGRKGSEEDDNHGGNWGKNAIVCDPWASGLPRNPASASFGPPHTFGDSYTAYPTEFLKKNMEAMFPGLFKGASLVHRED